MSLELENRKIKHELEEYCAEASVLLKNQQATIRRLEERNRQLEIQMEKVLRMEEKRLMGEIQQRKETLINMKNLSDMLSQVVSDKQLVKHLQKEVARLEAELRTPEVSSLCSESLLMEKELKIKQMEMEMEELKQERDLAKLQLEKLQRKVV